MAFLESKHRLDHAALEAWLHKEVTLAFDRLKADPSRARSLDKLRAALAAEHAQAMATKQTVSLNS